MHSRMQTPIPTQTLICTCAGVDATMIHTSEHVVCVKFLVITIRYLGTSKDIASENVIQNFSQFLIVPYYEV